MFARIAQQDLGLYGNLFVRSPDAGFFAPADREEVLILDDFLVDDKGAPVPYGADASTHALMGRFGNLFLVNGSPEYSLRVVARRGRSLLSHERLEHARLQRLGSRRAPQARRWRWWV